MYPSLKLKHQKRKVAESFQSHSQNEINLMGDHCIKCSDFFKLPFSLKDDILKGNPFLDNNCIFKHKSSRVIFIYTALYTQTVAKQLYTVKKLL